jgi:hypothetical protein
MMPRDRVWVSSPFVVPMDPVVVATICPLIAVEAGK